jgi:outer membrane protein
MKRTWICLLAIVIAAFLAMPVQAAPAKKDAKDTKESVIKLGVVNMAKILRDSKAAKMANDILKKDADEKNSFLNAKQKEIQAMEAELKSDDLKLASDERREKMEKHAKESRDLKRQIEDLSVEYKKKDAEFAQKITVEAIKIIKDYQQKENFTAIFSTANVIAVDDTVDITDEIIKLYDTKK